MTADLVTRLATLMAPRDIVTPEWMERAAALIETPEYGERLVRALGNFQDEWTPRRTYRRLSVLNRLIEREGTGNETLFWFENDHKWSINDLREACRKHAFSYDERLRGYDRSEYAFERLFTVGPFLHVGI